MKGASLLLSTPEETGGKFEKEKSNHLSASALPMTLRPREGAGKVHISEGPPQATPILSPCISPDF